jgi:hypothetical protein
VSVCIAPISLRYISARVSMVVAGLATACAAPTAASTGLRQAAQRAQVRPGSPPAGRRAAHPDPAWRILAVEVIKQLYDGLVMDASGNPPCRRSRPDDLVGRPDSTTPATA